ncbi:MAG: hypothetical protein ABIQ95_04195 [Bdellovibrionia bacterium]
MLKSLGLWFGLFGYDIDRGLARSTALNLDSEHKILIQSFRMQFDPMFSRCFAAFRNGIIQAPAGFSNVNEEKNACFCYFPSKWGKYSIVIYYFYFEQ